MCLNPVCLPLRPETMKNPKMATRYRGNRNVMVPCGHCEECLKDYQNGWMLRLCEEFKNSKKAIFFTLTYRPSKVPKLEAPDGTLHNTVFRKDITNALKRFRIFLQRKGDFTSWKYFITSEYGPTTLRPHYHGLVFGLDKSQFLPFLQDWRKYFGFYKCDVIPYSDKDWFNVSRYVSKYCSKGVFENPKIRKGLVLPTFHSISKGIGSTYVARMADFHLGKTQFHGRKYVGSRYSPDYVKFVTENSHVFIGSVVTPYKMPRYYKEQIFGNKPLLQKQMSDYVFQMANDARMDRAQEIQAFYGLSSIDEAFCFTYKLDDALLKERGKTVHVGLADFYQRSQL